MSCLIVLKVDGLQLYDFFHRTHLGHALHEQLGFDPSMEMINKEAPQAEFLKAALNSLPKHMSNKKVFADQLWSLYRVAVPDKDDTTETHLDLRWRMALWRTGFTRRTGELRAVVDMDVQYYTGIIVQISYM